MKRNTSTRESAETKGIASKPPVLSWVDLDVGSDSGASVCLRKSDLTVRQGELLVVHCEMSHQTRFFASVLQGLKPPSAGTVLFDQTDWTAMNDETLFRSRGQIGRVFDGVGWIANLNVTENMMLSRQHHGDDDAVIMHQMEHWAEQIGLHRISRQRPAFVAPGQLQIHQWIRAFLGPPKLVILERPMRYVASKWRQKLTDAVQSLRKQATAVVWISDVWNSDHLESLGAEHRLDVRHPELNDGDDA
ncbi:ATP-binding cassette domain-containing protein [Crateriforma conspicua]|uniref:Bacitracin export ATP-binding protein BceA n=1 Tax=Crateriforma conspicua TaxID=2527996 RepID=A0A5C5Y6U5_9PLAN|nr:ATP-binding cassette domain-containing protein [Crateriforma conspicua]TWT70473.1 Bacitracin export ATP-binding protein BceA [Crateriforma conspicua]